jgi:hypothetical protein
MKGDVKILYGNLDIFAGICPAPFVYFDKEYIENGQSWGSKYNLKLDGQITGKLDFNSFYDLEIKKGKLISGFIKDHLSFVIKEDKVTIFSSDICQIESISFDESKYFGVLPFSISASCYDSGSFGNHYGVMNPVDSWEYSESEDSMVSLKHSISAEGFNSSGISAIANVKKWASSRTGIAGKVSSLKIKDISGSDFVLDSFSEQVDRFNGKYSIQENYKADLLSSNSVGFGILRYTFDVNKNIDNGITSVSIEGSVIGKSNIGLADMSLLRAKLNAENFFDLAANCAMKSTGAIKLNSTPVSRSIAENINNSEITFSIKYDDNPIAPGKAKCIYKVELSENLIKKIVDIKLDAEIVCDRGDQSIRWAAVNDYYVKDFKAYNLSLIEYTRAGYTKKFSTTPKTESINFDEFNAKISYSASWSDRYMPYSDILSSISERVEITPSLNIYTIQPSLKFDAEHNVQDFSCASRTSVTISIDATCRPDKTMALLKGCVTNEMDRLKGIYVKYKNLFLDNISETTNDNLRKMSLSRTYSFDGLIVNVTDKAP